jgi:hypothetical protein
LRLLGARCGVGQVAWPAPWLESADPIPATWAALLLAIAPAPLTAAVLVVGIAGQVTHTGLFFVPALVVMAVAAVKLWRETA